MNPDGTGATNLTHTLATQALYRWSGDGSLIIASALAGEDWSTEIIQTGGSGIISLK